MTLNVAYSYIILDSGSEEAQIIDLEVAENRKKVKRGAKKIVRKTKRTAQVISIGVFIWLAGNELVSRYPNQGPTQSPTQIERTMKRFIDLRGGQNRPLGNPMRKVAGKMAQKSVQKSTMKSLVSRGRGRQLLGITPMNPHQMPPGMSHGPRTVKVINQYSQQSQNHLRSQGLKMEAVKGNRFTQIDDDVIKQDDTVKKSEVKNIAKPTDYQTPEPAKENSVDQGVAENQTDQKQGADNLQVMRPRRKIQRVSDSNVNQDGTIKMQKVAEIEKETGEPFDRTADSKTKDRRSEPMFKSGYEDETNDFKPAYSVQQVQKKDHTGRVLEKSGEMSESDFDKLPDSEKIKLKMLTKEDLINHPDTLFYHNATHEGNTKSGHLYSEPASVAINHGFGDYKMPGHAMIFENNAAYQLDAYISDYILSEKQRIKFNNSIPTGPVIGSHKTAWPTPAPTAPPTVSPTVPPADVPTGAPTVFDVEL